MNLLYDIATWVLPLSWAGFGAYRYTRWLMEVEDTKESNRRSYSGAPAEPPKPIGKKLLIQHLIPALVLLVAMLSIYSVDEGSASALKRFGAVQPGVAHAGLHLKAPMVDDIVRYRTVSLNYETGANPEASKADYPDFNIQTMTSDGQAITISYSIVFHIDPAQIPNIIKTIGTEQDVVERVVKTISRSEGRNIPKSFKAADLYGSNVYVCEKAMFDKLEPMFAERGVVLEKFLLREITFDADLTAALEQKQIALEKQVTSERMVQVAKNEASATIEGARGQAEAAKLMQAQLEKSPSYNQYILMQAIAAGKLPNLTYLGVDPVVTMSK